ncbi:MAG: hypothetical protein AAFP86_02670 [Planctomycetota bacterium]
MEEKHGDDDASARAGEEGPPDAVARSGDDDSYLLDLFGWVGTAAILGAYAGISFGWIDRGTTYQLLNLGGAAGVAGVCWARRTWQPLFLQVVWGAVALVALLRAL